MNKKTDLYLMQANKIIKLNEKHNFEISEVSRASPQIINNYTSYEFSDGNRSSDSNFDSFDIEFTCRFKTNGNVDYHVRLDELFEDIFIRKEYYIFHTKTPGKKILRSSGRF
ncbi:phage tail domain-containing protein [Listeria monocytogenes]